MLGKPRDHVASARDHYQRAGLAGLKEYFGKLYARKALAMDGENVYEREWDVLLVLDGCRVDLLQEVASEYAFLESCESLVSVASKTSQWMHRTFEPAHADAMARTAYVCGNPYSASMLDAGDFAMLDEVWRYAWDDDAGTVLPRPVTDRAITIWRDESPDRMVCHYMQPHTPFVAAGRKSDLAVSEFGERRMDDTWLALQRGTLTHETVWDQYLENLRYVLDDVELLIDSVTAETIAISSDHGNAMGELGIYGHPPGVEHPVLREVPWCPTTGDRTTDYEPTEYDRQSTGRVAEHRLRDLGYVPD